MFMEMSFVCELKNVVFVTMCTPPFALTKSKIWKDTFIMISTLAAELVCKYFDS
jgi:hypothetical protein